MIFNRFCVKRPAWLLVKLANVAVLFMQCSVLQIMSDCCRVTVSDGNSCAVHLTTSSVLLNFDRSF